MAKLEQQLKAAANKADLYKKKIAQLEAKLGGGAEEESSSEEEDESSDDEDELPFDKKHLLHLTFDKPASLGLAYAPASDNRVKVARIMPGSQAAKQKKKPKAGYFLCMVNKKRVYEVGYDKVMVSRCCVLLAVQLLLLLLIVVRGCLVCRRCSSMQNGQSHSPSASRDRSPRLRVACATLCLWGLSCQAGKIFVKRIVVRILPLSRRTRF